MELRSCREGLYLIGYNMRRATPSSYVRLNFGSSRALLICQREVDSSFRLSGVIVTPVKTGVHPHPLNWIPFSNGMTDAVGHLDTGGSFS